jgi:hypothetical protein
MRVLFLIRLKPVSTSMSYKMFGRGCKERETERCGSSKVWLCLAFQTSVTLRFWLRRHPGHGTGTASHFPCSTVSLSFLQSLISAHTNLTLDRCTPTSQHLPS